MKKPIRTKVSMVYRSFRLPKNDAQKWLAAASVAGISRSQLLREALRDKADLILNRPVEDKMAS
jgi:hypothetical protein